MQIFLFIMVYLYKGDLIDTMHYLPVSTKNNDSFYYQFYGIIIHIERIKLSIFAYLLQFYLKSYYHEKISFNTIDGFSYPICR